MVAAGIILGSLAAGCTVYRPLPITTEATQTKLQSPDLAELRILASKINHPLLPPLELKAGENLTPDGAAVLAVLLNPALRTLRDQRALAKAQLFEAGLLPNPEVTYSLGIPTGGDTAGRADAFGLGLDWNVTSLIARSAKLQEAKARQESVDLAIAWQEWQVAQGAKAAVYQLASLRKRITLLEEVRRQIAKNLANIRDAVEKGSLTTAALNSARAANAHADESLLELQKQADQQRLKLLRLIGMPPDSPVDLSHKIRLPSLVTLPKAKVFLAGLTQRRLDLLALKRGYDSQEATVRAAVLEQFPRIVIGPAIGRDTDNVRTAGFSLNIELPILNRHQGKIARARATRQTLFDEYANRIFEARSDIAQAASTIHFLNDRIATAKAAEADLARQEANYRSALAEGRTDALVYYAAWQDRIDSQTQIFDLEGQLAQAVVALEVATGFYEIPRPELTSKAPPKKPTTGKEQ